VDTVGAYLSGGVDSSTVTGVLTEVLGKPVDTFSIGFGVENFNEINYARLASNAFRSRHHEYFVTPEDTFRAIPLLAGMFDEPYANASAIPAYYCAKMAKENSIDILYAGDGGDELFAGNERYSFMRLFEYYSGLPPWLREAVVKPLVFGAGDLLNLEILDKGKKYIRRASLPYYRRITSYDIFSTVPLSEFLEGDFLAAVGKDYDPFSQYRRYYFEAPADCELDRHLYLDWYLTLSDNDLIKVTRTAEAAGVDVRFPFLDHKLVEFSVSVPARIKMRGTRLRTFFKRAYADLLPPEIRKKKKHGFGLPIPVWLKTDKRLNGLMRDLVLGPQAAQRGYFRKKSIENLVEEHKRDTTSYYGTILWNLMAMELWFRYSASPPIRQ
jgi:asparagine synthase (glutamine-hydrolysing)